MINEIGYAALGLLAGTIIEKYSSRYKVPHDVWETAYESVQMEVARTMEGYVVSIWDEEEWNTSLSFVLEVIKENNIPEDLEKALNSLLLAKETTKLEKSIIFLAAYHLLGSEVCKQMVKKHSIDKVFVSEGMIKRRRRANVKVLAGALKESGTYMAEVGYIGTEHEMVTLFEKFDKSFV